MPRITLDTCILPPKLAPLRRFRGRVFTLLDVGCGNHSASLVKHWHPACRYFGVDRENYNNDPADYTLMERFYPADLEASDLGGIPDGYFDAILCTHVIEHLRGGLGLLQRLCAKLTPGGQIYIEFPGVRSLVLPSAHGSLHFSDDPTHVRLYALPEVCNILLAEGLVLRRAGTRRNWPRLALTPAMALGSWLRHGAVTGSACWDLLGFAEFVWAERPVPPPAELSTQNAKEDSCASSPIP